MACCWEGWSFPYMCQWILRGLLEQVSQHRGLEGVREGAEWYKDWAERESGEQGSDGVVA